METGGARKGRNDGTRERISSYLELPFPGNLRHNGLLLRPSIRTAQGTHLHNQKSYLLPLVDEKRR